MRYEKGHKDASRERILAAASQRFRSEGVAAVGIATIMADAGLTNGAFYSHFASKEALVRETVVRALAEREETLRNLGHSASDLETVLRAYLSKEHRDNPGVGCASAALAAEIAREPTATRVAYADQVATFIDLITGFLPPAKPAAQRRRAWAIYGSLIGTLQLARAVPDSTLSNEILEGGIDAARKLFAPEPPDERPTKKTRGSRTSNERLR